MLVWGFGVRFCGLVGFGSCSPHGTRALYLSRTPLPPSPARALAPHPHTPFLPRMCLLRGLSAPWISRALQDVSGCTRVLSLLFVCVGVFCGCVKLYLWVACAPLCSSCLCWAVWALVLALVLWCRLLVRESCLRAWGGGGGLVACV